ncbi:prepilin-type N-terminal cleavage/methylation domain-containing protein [Verrucomicrobium sp. GAS474]|uniref:prepilin-type N-terminal cleavage/methylation domain-containing protein n=1 Tax=Verrucomicrobium sp. GAS474 TaxID=1882831 RepID=UPI000B81DB61|nr:prepilin-type N-terminal cleavage/methylation domain-containing protein [Verrucomicrobium sp. GAS474]
MRRGFTLVEILCAATIALLVMAVVLGVTIQAANAQRSTGAKIGSFQRARAAFDILAQTLGQATLNTTLAYDNAAAPTAHIRSSDLQFISGKTLVPSQVTHAVFFQAPLGYSSQSSYALLGGALNACGFFIQYGPDPSRPSFLERLGATRPVVARRFRLMQFLQPTENFALYDASAAGNTSWFSSALAANSHEIADDIIALVILPRDQSAAPLVSDYEYDSRAGAAVRPQPVTAHQLPPLVEIVLVALDETSAQQLGDTKEAPDVGLAGLFVSASRLEDDLRVLGLRLAERHLTYRVFRTTLSLPGAKWSL